MLLRRNGSESESSCPRGYSGLPIGVDRSPGPFRGFLPGKTTPRDLYQATENCETALASKYEEGGDSKGCKHNNGQDCIEQIPHWKIFIFTVQFLDPCLGGILSYSQPILVLVLRE